jgi:hypothetical protein
MANEAFLSINFNARKNGASIGQPMSKRFDMTGSEMAQLTQNIGTTAEVLDFANIPGAPQAVMLQNLDATNFVEIGGDSGLTVFKFKINPGQAAYFTPTSGTVYAKANTAAVNILILAIEA